MPDFFAPSEVVQMGIQIEVNGKDFYTALASAPGMAAAKAIFIFLAGEEERHIHVFESILGSVEKYEPPEAYTEEYFAYLKALADDHVFTKKNKGTEAAQKVSSPLDAIEVALGFEKDSILLYLEMKKLVPAPGQKTIDKLIEQEQEHVRRLSTIKREMNG
jgi:rubrerythrin